MLTKTKEQFLESIPFKVSELPTAFSVEIGRVKGYVWQARNFFAELPCMSAQCDRLRAEYVFENDVTAANIYTLVVGASGSGKRFLKRLYEDLMYLYCAESDRERDREQEYREKVKTAGKGPKPENPHTIIQEYTGGVSQAALQQSAANCLTRYGEPLSFFFFLEEATILSKGNRVAFSDMRDIMRLGFDFASRFANSRAHADCCAQTVSIRLNSLMSTTYSGLLQLFPASEVDQGSSMRYLFVELNDPIDAPSAETRPMSDDEKKRLDTVLRALREETFNEEGKLQPEIWLDMSWLFPEMKKWCAAAQKRAEEMGSISYRNSSRRASMIAFRASMLLYHLYHLDNQLFDDVNRDEEWIREKIKKIYKWVASYTLRSGYSLFGETMERELENATKGRNFKELLDFLPAQFSRQQLVEISQAKGYTNKVSVRLSQWKKEGKIKEIGKKLYEKINRR